MCIKKYIITITLALTGLTTLYAQQERTEICIDFRVNSRTIDSTYMENAVRLDEIMYHINRLRQDTTLSVTQLTLTGAASPEGNAQLNRRLASERMQALEQYIRSHTTLPDSLIIRHTDTYIPWHYLTSKVKESDLPRKEEILSILHREAELVPYYHQTTIDSRIPALQKLDNGRIWQILKKRYFAQMRNACAVLITLKKETEQHPEVNPEPTDTIVSIATPILESVTDTIVPIPMEVSQSRSLYLKSNAIGWGLLIANVAIEVDLGKHWSATLPIYYSAMNYFTSDIKLRTLCFQPEVRYWLNENNERWFIGAHFSLAWYNYAKGTEWRYQDHDGKTPLWGVGISGGYRMPITKNHKWWLEFSLGTGVCKLHYDIFHNEYDGPHVDTRKKTFFGIDQAAVSIAYRFNLKKGGIR